MAVLAQKLVWRKEKLHKKKIICTSQKDKTSADADTELLQDPVSSEDV